MDSAHSDEAADGAADAEPVVLVSFHDAFDREQVVEELEFSGIG